MKKAFLRVALAFWVGALSTTVASAVTIDPVSNKPCAQCHRSKVTGAFIHDALTDQECTPCHDNTGGNHQSNHALYAVKDKSAKLCYQCHDNQSSKKSVHPPIMEDDCLVCHVPHNSPLKNLLRYKVPRLCFQCHDRALLETKETDKATGFRDGTENLHFVHANVQQISCFTCHDIHASDQDHLIRPKGTNGTEAVTITYKATDKGGNCTVSCHDALGYERK